MNSVATIDILICDTDCQGEMCAYTSMLLCLVHILVLLKNLKANAAGKCECSSLKWGLCTFSLRAEFITLKSPSYFQP